MALRQARRNAGMTQEELAERAHLSWRGISDIERGVRQLPRRETVALLAGALGLEGDARADFEALARPSSSIERGVVASTTQTDVQTIEEPSVRYHPPTGATRLNFDPDQRIPRPDPRTAVRIEPMNNLPRRMTSFLGRRDALASISTLVGSAGLVTIVGPGGCGKTRLALEVAGSLRHDFADGVWFVDLAPVDSPERVAMTVSSTLGIQQEAERGGDSPLAGRWSVSRTAQSTTIDILRRWLATRSVLLVLDNCEHVVESCALLADNLLQAAPGLTILATSRESLAIAAERVWPLSTLPTPAEGSVTTDDIAQSDAVLLFVERAQARRPDFCLDDETAPIVSEIVRRLDGLPLAIELAAALVEELPLRTIAERLDHSLALLTRGPRMAAPRHQALRATLEWSHERLSEPERMLFRRLAVFCGSWSLEACEQLFTDNRPDPPVATLVGKLVRKSLVQRTENGARYKLLETMRQFAGEQLVESGEEETIRDVHLAWCLSLALEAEPLLKGRDQLVWFARLDAEYEQFAGAMAWALASEQRVEQAAMLASALVRFWQGRGRLNDGSYWLERCLQGADPARLPPTLYARLLCAAGMIAWNQCRLVRARALLRQSNDVGGQAGDKQGAAYAAFWLSFVYWFREQFEDCSAQLHIALALFEEVGDRWGAAMARKQIGHTASSGSDRDRAEELLAESEAELIALGDIAESTWARFARAGCVIDRGDRAAGRALLLACVPVAEELKQDRLAAMAQSALAWVALLDDDPAEALPLFEAVHAIGVRAGDPMLEVSALRGMGVAHAFLNNLDEACRSLGFAVGVAQRLGDAQMIAYALADLAYALVVAGDLEQADTAARECLALAHSAGDEMIEATAWMVLGHLAARAGAHQQALIHFRQSLETLVDCGCCRENAPRRTLVLALLGMASSLTACGKTSHVPGLIRAVESLRKVQEVILLPLDKERFSPLLSGATRWAEMPEPGIVSVGEALVYGLAAVNERGQQTLGEYQAACSELHALL
jgi:predicted ATPase/transcriptional regulator with XRE-family HTH domain